MERQEFEELLGRFAEQVEQIRQSAHALHLSVNQTYDKVHPYGFHLDMVADAVCRYAYSVCQSGQDVLPIVFGAFYHDSMEDARLTYNDVKRAAAQWMNEEQASMAAEIVYALTNEKGRTRVERANDKYYQGIRRTPYAPLVKLADRLANITYSFTHTNEANSHMKQVYRAEQPHFLSAIKSESQDKRFSLPKHMINAIEEVMQENN